MSKKTLVIGTSTKPERISFQAIERLVQHGHKVAAIGLKHGTVAGVIIQTSQLNYTDIDTVTLYLSPENQKSQYEYILNLKPKRIIFNPGTENPELVNLAKQKGIETEYACTLVLLATNAY